MKFFCPLNYSDRAGQMNNNINVFRQLKTVLHLSKIIFLAPWNNDLIFTFSCPSKSR